MERGIRQHKQPEEKLIDPTPEPQPVEKAPEKLTWKKLGGGSLRLKIDGRTKIIKKNQVFEALESEIPKAFRDSVKMVKGEAVSPARPAKVRTSVYKISSSGDDAMYNVVGENKKVLNENPLTFDEAEELVERLTKG